ncbi:MAG: RNA polymerase sporulation sigma factor SigG [Clostridia bacterium]|nr:RNA polymerase sporulation sigma factor SigG [Clostridia bacterium]
MKNNGKVEICGVNTATLTTLTDEEKRELLLAAHAGDTKAREKLVMGNLRLVLSIVGRFSARRENPEDLFQVGCIGLMKAIDNFNTDLDVKFSTYAVPMIIGEVRRYLRDNNSIRVSRSVRDLAYRALQVRDKLVSEEGRDPSVEQIAKKLGEPTDAVSRAMEAIVEPMSLYDAVYSDGEDSVYVIDQLADPDETEEAWVESMSLRQSISRLGQREQHIIRERFWRGKTQMEIAEEIGISQAQVSRLEKGAIEKMKREFS